MNARLIFPILTAIIIHEITTLRLIKAFIFAVSYFIKKLQIILKLILELYTELYAYLSD